VPRDVHDRVLTTVVFTDIVGSSDIAAELGDARWKELLRRHRELIRCELKRFGGTEVDTAGDGFFATVPKPASAVRYAVAATEAVRDLGIEIRAGLHFGECEAAGKLLSGIAVHTGARVMSLAGPGEVLVTATVRDLIAGAGLEMGDAGRRRLKGIPGEWRLYRVDAVDGRPMPLSTDAHSAAARRAAIEPPSALARALGRRTSLIAATAVVVVAVGVVALVLRGADDESAVPDASPFAPSETLDHALVAIDPATDHVSKSIRNERAIGSNVAAGQAGVWVINALSLSWWHVDPETESVVSVPGPPCVLPGGRGIAVLDQAVWMASSCGISRINPATNAVVENVDLRGRADDRIKAGRGMLWVMTSAGLTRIDPTTNTQVAIPRAIAGDDLAVGEGWVWITDRLDQTLTRVDAKTGEADETVVLQMSLDAIEVGAGAVWIADGAAGTVTMVHPQTLDVIDTIQVGADPYWIAVSGDAAWVANRGDGTVSRIDPDLYRVVDEVDIGGPIGGISVDLATGLVWVLVSRCLEFCGAPPDPKLRHH
jgi:class 3 adenylate cyclase/DNA-binding beta-propeller fold protein YncE